MSGAPDSQTVSERRIWSETDHETQVERFYTPGIGDDHDWQGGYRNFGWWADDPPTYIAAADALVAQMALRLGMTADSRLLDVACGCSAQDLFLHRLTGATIDGVDATWVHVKKGQWRMREAGVSDKVRIQHGTATDLQFPRETFTHALCIEGAQHFNTREKFFHEAFAVLKPGGVMALADFMITAPATNPWQRMVVRKAQTRWNVPDANVLDEAGFRQSLERAGFANVTIECVGKHTIPGYYRDQSSAKTASAQRKLMGRRWRFNMVFTNYFLHAGWKKGLFEYVLVRAEKPR